MKSTRAVRYSLATVTMLAVVTSVVLVATTGLALMGPTLGAGAVVQGNTCPDGGDWVKVEPIGALSYTYDIPEGYEVVKTCIKVGNHPPLFEVIDPPAQKG